MERKGGERARKEDAERREKGSRKCPHTLLLTSLLL
jgi:hypothetical protein